MLIAKLDTLEIGTPSRLYPQTSFSESGPNQEWLNKNNCQIVGEPPHNYATQRLADCPPYVDSNGQILRHVVVNLTTDEITQLGLSNYELLQMLSLNKETESN